MKVRYLALALWTGFASVETAAQSALPRKDIPAIAKAANGAIVSIVMSDDKGKPIVRGSGFLVSKDGLIMTNYHVIAEGSSAVVKLPDGAFYVVDGVLAFDKARDIAVIKAHGQSFRTLALGNSDRVEVGEEVVAIGNPLSLESTVSNGIVSGIRTLKEEGGKFLQVTAPISPGSSGGPLFNMTGEVIGITTLYLKGGENLNFAIPINDAKRLLLAGSTKLQNLPNEPEPVQAQTHDGDARSNARDYYQHLYDAGGFFLAVQRYDIHGPVFAPDGRRVMNPRIGYVCFSDDAHSEIFFTFEAHNYDEEYIEVWSKLSEAEDKFDELTGATPPNKEEVKKQWNEIEKQRDIVHAFWQTAPYVDFYTRRDPKLKKLFPNGGAYLIATNYEKGVAGGTLYFYERDNNLWVDSIPNATQTGFSKILHLSIEPTTLRYLETITVMTTTGSGETIDTDTGVCETVKPGPEAK
jgi:S1-C subfamily serine protease